MSADAEASAEPSRRTVLLTKCALALLVGVPVGWFAWALLCFTPQVNAMIACQRATDEIVAWRAEQLGIDRDDAKRTLGTSGPLPETLETRDFWGRPLVYLRDGSCFVLVSYGSDGEPDRNATYDTSLCRHVPEPRSTCLWPTIDTLFVNGGAVRACSK